MIKFTKLQASGNDFILIDQRKAKPFDYKKFAAQYCPRKFGIGADGVLVIEASKTADFKMRIFNSDGSEADMCGNGSRCVALWSGKKQVKFETKAGMIEAALKSDGTVKTKLTKPFGLKLNIPVDVFGRSIKANFLNSGVPHAVIFVDSLQDIDVAEIGREIRFHKQFAPAGANVNFIQVADKDFLHIRTYERGVEDETLACGTGSVASAVIFGIRSDFCGPVRVKNASGEITKVYFERNGETINNVWLEGKAYQVFTGELKGR